MFDLISEYLDKARARVLRTAFEDSMRRLSTASQDVQARYTALFANCYRVIDKEYGSVSKISNKDKLTLSSQLKNEADKIILTDVGHGYGLIMLSAFLEARALRGKDAYFVRQNTRELLTRALRATKNEVL